MKRILGYISIIGMLGVTAWLVFSLITNPGKIFPQGKPVPANMPKVEDVSHTKLEFPKVESEDPSPPNQPPAPIPPSSSTPTPESEPPFSPDCDPFEGMDLSLVILSIREDIMVLPLYLKTAGEAIPGMIHPPEPGKPAEYHALLGDIESNSCGLQEGFDDRLYCMFSVTPDMPGSAAEFSLYLGDCEDPVYTQLYVSIPELKTQCTKDLGESDCNAAGGEMKSDDAGVPYCKCP